MKRVFLLIIILFVSACSMFEQKKSNEFERTISTKIEPYQLKVDQIDKNTFVSINFEVLGKNSGDNRFTIKLPQALRNDLDFNLPYNVFINTNEVECLENSTIEELEKNFEYKVVINSKPADLDCSYEGLDPIKLVSVTYIFHHHKELPGEKVRRFVRAIAHKEKDAKRFLAEVNSGREIKLYDERLFFDVLATKSTVRFGPKKSSYRWKLKANKKDIVRLYNPIGEFKLTCSGLREEEKIKSVSFKGKSSVDFKNVSAVECEVDTGELTQIELINLKREVTLNVAVIRHNELSKKITEFFDDPELALKGYIVSLNQENLDTMVSFSKNTIEIQKQKVKLEQKLSRFLPYKIQKSVSTPVELTRTSIKYCRDRLKAFYEVYDGEVEPFVKEIKLDKHGRNLAAIECKDISNQEALGFLK